MIRNKLTNRSNEFAFVITLLVGALIVGLSITYIGIGATLGVDSPSPYMESWFQRNLMLTVSIFGLGIGVLIMRGAFKWIGW